MGDFLDQSVGAQALEQIEAIVFRVASPPFVVIPIVLLIAILKYRLSGVKRKSIAPVVSSQISQKQKSAPVNKAIP